MPYENFKALNKETRKKNLKALRNKQEYDWQHVAEIYKEKIEELLDKKIDDDSELYDLIYSACYSSSIIKEN